MINLYIQYFIHKNDIRRQEIDFCFNINIITNSDIFFDESINLLNDQDLTKKFIALTRWDINIKTGKSKFFNVAYSQDSFFWKGYLNLDGFDLNYYLGTPGIDNALCGEFHEMGFKVINPSYQLK